MSIFYSYMLCFYNCCNFCFWALNYMFTPSVPRWRFSSGTSSRIKSSQEFLCPVSFIWVKEPRPWSFLPLSFYVITPSFWVLTSLPNSRITSLGPYSSWPISLWFCPLTLTTLVFPFPPPSTKQVSSKSVKNFLSYLRNRLEHTHTHTQTHTKTDRHNDADENNTCPKTKFLGQVIT